MAQPGLKNRASESPSLLQNPAGQLLSLTFPFLSINKTWKTKFCFCFTAIQDGSEISSGSAANCACETHFLPSWWHLSPSACSWNTSLLEGKKRVFTPVPFPEHTVCNRIFKAGNIFEIRPFGDTKMPTKEHMYFKEKTADLFKF